MTVDPQLYKNCADFSYIARIVFNETVLRGIREQTFIWVFKVSLYKPKHYKRFDC